MFWERKIWLNMKKRRLGFKSALFWEFTRFCSKSIWIGTVVVFHWVGCVCNQSWHVRTCLSNSWHKLQVAAFSQLVAVGRGSNTCVYVTAIFTMCESTEQRICIKFCFKIGKTAKETNQLLQQAYAEDAMGRTQAFDWFRRFKEGRTSVESDPRSGRPSRSRNEEMIAKVRTIVRNNRGLTLRGIADDCATSAWMSSPKTTGKMAGWRLDPAQRQCARTHFTSCAADFGQTRHRSVAAAAILTRSRTVWLFSYSQGLRKFWKDTDLRQRRTSNEIRRRHY